MERRSDKHTPRLDDEMSQETDPLVRGSPLESRADEAREQEGPGNDEPVPDALVAGEAEAADGELSPEEANRRAELARYLTRAAFPGTADELRAAARSHGAPRKVLDALAALPPGRFQSAAEVWSALPERGQDPGAP